MNVCFILRSNSWKYAGGQRTLAANVCRVLGGTIVASTEIKPKWRRHPELQLEAEQQASVQLGVPVVFAETDDEVVAACIDADAVFCIGFRAKKWPTFEDCLSRIKCKKVAFILATSETMNAGAFLRSRIWDAYWSERPMIREYLRAKGKVDASKPYTVGCNVYQPSCPLTAEQLVEHKEPRLVVSNSRFASMKRSAELLGVFDHLSRDPTLRLEAWGWKPNEGGFSFKELVKIIPERFDAWNRIGKHLAQGEYSADQVPGILSPARFAIDLTYMRGDGSRWGDGGLQYCQAEAIDWGTIPVCGSEFHLGAEWSSIMHLVPALDPKLPKLVYDIVTQRWDPAGHADMIERGREYIEKNLSFERFNASIAELVGSLEG